MSLSGNDIYTLSLHHFNGINNSTTMTEDTINEINHVWTPHVNAKLSTSSPKFGTAALLLDGSSWIDTPASNDFCEGSGDFTIDFWVKRARTLTRECVCACASSIAGNYSFWIEFTATDTMQVLVDNAAGSTSYSVTSGSTKNSDTTNWHHVGFIRYVNGLYLYMDGIQVGTTDITGVTLMSSTAYHTSIGRGGEYAGLYFSGGVDEWRVSKPIARWIANFNTNLPTEYDGPNIGHPNTIWNYHTAKYATEHSVIVGGEAYVPAYKTTNSTGGLFCFNLTTGILSNEWVDANYIPCCPVVSGGYGFIYDHLNNILKRINVSTGSVTNTISSLTNLDIESMGWDTVNNVVILPIGTVLRGYNMADLSTAWSFTVTTGTTYQSSSPLVVGNYIYYKAQNDTILYQLNLSNGTQNATCTGLGSELGAFSYMSPIYDADHGYIYCHGAPAQVHCVRISDMSLIWSQTVGSGMTTPSIHNAIGYNNGLVFVPCRDEGAEYQSKIYALNYSSGSIVWTNSDPWNDGYEAPTPLLTTSRLIVASLNNANFSQGNLYIINQSNGNLISKAALMYGCSCGGATAVSNGIIIVNENGGWVEAIKLGGGTTDDSAHYMKNSYHNGYCSTRLRDPTDSLFTCQDF